MQILSYHDIVIFMEIQYLHDYCLVLKGKKEQVVIDPEEKNGFEGRVVVSTKNMWTFVQNSPDQLVIAGPGEYEVGGVELTGISAGQGSTVYAITIDGVSVGVMGEPIEDLTEKKIERIDSLDVLFVPCAKKSLEKLKLYLSWAKKWGVNYVIPVGYESEDELKTFLDVVDREDLLPVASLKISRDELPEGLEVVVLNRHE